jgi:glycosyltransferase involved in cell wall biosynthesis
MGLSIFVPAYNEENIIEDRIKKIYAFLNKNFKDFEIVIVNDGSTDKTLLLLNSLAKKNKKMKLLSYSNGPSRRENLAKAMKSAKYDVVGFFDLDLSTPLEFLPKLYEKIKEGYDIAIGSRRIRSSKAKRSNYRLIWSSLYHKTIQVFFKSKVHDYQCGFKLFKKSVFLNLSNKVGYDSKFQRGWFWDAEVLLEAEKRNYSIYEMAVNWIEGETSSFDFFREFKTLRYILKKRFIQ